MKELAAGAKFRSNQTPMPHWNNARRSPSVVVVARTQDDVNMVAGRDIWYHEVKDTVDAECPPEEMGSEDPLSSFTPPVRLASLRCVTHNRRIHGLCLDDA